MIARRLVITGRVQGVGFRESLIAVALDEQVRGWVRNLHEGSVEAFVQGEPDAVLRIIEWCHRGPSLARVTRVDVAPAEVDAGQGVFAQRPTV
jgi:acylphosphatase